MNTQYVIIAALIVAILYVMYSLWRGLREGFASKQAREVTAQARGLFDKNGGDATYTQYKERVTGADPVQYRDVRQLHRAGQLTPEAVDAVL